MIDYKRIQKDCFWDLSINEKDIIDIVKGDDLRMKSMLFEKILLNSTRLFADLKIFPDFVKSTTNKYIKTIKFP